MNRTIVQKYGGSSVATPEKLARVAKLVVDRCHQGYDLVVVVSAMGDATDELLAKAKAITPSPDRRELDMLLSVGERISMALLAMAIRELGHDAVSLTGSQSGIITTASHTNARIMEVRPFRVQDELAAGRVVIVAGYQGVSYKRDITTLGRGGSDTTAVALAAALNAEACEIYSDVDGVYTADPRVVPDAVPLESLSYDEMQALAASGAKVLNHQAVEFAMRRNIAIYARQTGSHAPGTVVRRDAPAPPSGVRGIAHQRRVARVRTDASTLDRVQAFLRMLGDLSVSPMLSRYGGATAGPFGCVVALDDVHGELATAVAEHFGPGAFDDASGTISLVGDGMGPTVVATAIDTLSKRAIAIEEIFTTTLSATFVIRSERIIEGAQALHEALGLPAA